MKVQRNYYWLAGILVLTLGLHCPLPLGAHELGGSALASTNPTHTDNLPWWYHWVHYGLIGGAIVIGGGIAVYREWKARKIPPIKPSTTS